MRANAWSGFDTSAAERAQAEEAAASNRQSQEAMRRLVEAHNASVAADNARSTIEGVRQLADQGNVEDAYTVGAHAMLGDIMPRNHALGVRYLTQAANGGYRDAAKWLHSYYRGEYGNTSAVSFMDARRWAARVAELGGTEKEYLMAAFEESSVGNPEAGIAKNPARALQYVRQILAADPQDGRANFAMANALEQGFGLSANPAGAASYFRKAAEAGSQWAQYRIASGRLKGDAVFTQDTPQGVKDMQALAARRFPKAQALAGRWLVEGNPALGVARDAVRGTALLQGAESILVTGEGDFEMAYLCYRPPGACAGLAPDPEKYIKKLQAAAYWKHPAALYLLGVATLNGEGVPANPGAGLRLVTRALLRQHPPAMAELGRRLLYGEVLPHDEAKGLRLLEAAAERQWEPAARLLQVFWSVKEDTAQIRKWGGIADQLASVNRGDVMRQYTPDGD